jgi:hypothetical protein
MTNIVPISQAKMPAAMRDRMNSGAAVTKNFEEGVRDSFPLLSIKGKVFRIRISGQETPLIDQQTRQVIPSLDVVMINASPQLAKAYYVKGFEEGEFNQPDCWSLDSVKPDPMVPNKVSQTCINCPMNVFGSAPSRDATQGKRGGKACQDARRVAVMMPGHLELEEPLVFMMRVPATSLKNLKAYAQLLERQGWEPAACVTRLQFDYQEAYPKLIFNFVDGLNDEEYARVIDIAESKATADMLLAPDFDVAVSEEPVQSDRVEARVRQAAPVMETDLRQAGAVQQEQPKTQQEQPPAQQQAIHAVPDDPNIIELPDGQWFDQSTGEYIDRPQAKVDMPANDPNVTALPDGRFFNRTTRVFVSGPEVGAKVVEAAPEAKPAEPPKKARPSRVKAKADTPPADPAANIVNQAVNAKAQEQAGNGNGAAATGAASSAQKVAAAPAALDDIIRAVFPPVKN